jgi:long-chain fatty acid transport protein
MKIKNIILTFLMIMTANLLMGASIDHIMNYTVEYNANPALQGAISKESSVNFNPAGLIKLEDGTYINGGLQIAFGTQGMETSGTDYSADHVSPIPNLSIFKVEDNKAYFWTFGGIAGGAELDYKDGIATYDILGSHPIYGNIGSVGDGSSAKGSSMYLQTTLGTAFAINDKLSVAVAARGVYGKRDFSGNINIEGGLGNGQTATIDAERTATGFGGQFSINYAATPKLNLALRYDTKIKLKFKTDADEQKITGLPAAFGYVFGFSDIYPEYKDGAKGYRDLPAILALGMEYKVNNKWKIFTGGNYYFNSSADLDEGFATTGKEESKKYDDGYEIAFGTEYAINSKINWMAGINYAKTGASSVNYRDSEYAIDSTMVGTGIKYKYSDTLEFTFVVSHYFYDDSTGKTLTVPVEYHKSITNTGIGFNKKL